MTVIVGDIVEARGFTKKGTKKFSQNMLKNKAWSRVSALLKPASCSLKKINLIEMSEHPVIMTPFLGDERGTWEIKDTEWRRCIMI